jgi:hypothetical protein
VEKTKARRSVARWVEEVDATIGATRHAWTGGSPNIHRIIQVEAKSAILHCGYALIHIVVRIVVTKLQNDNPRVEKATKLIVCSYLACEPPTRHAQVGNACFCSKGIVEQRAEFLTVSDSQTKGIRVTDYDNIWSIIYIRDGGIPVRKPCSFV